MSCIAGIVNYNDLQCHQLHTRRLLATCMYTVSTKVLQGSVATRVNYDRIFIDSFTANLLLSVMIKEF